MGTLVEKARIGSLEERLNNIHSFIVEYYKDDQLEILATFDNRALVLLGDGSIHELSFARRRNGMAVTEDKISDDLKIISESELDVHVSSELENIAQRMAKGEDVDKSELLELSLLLNGEDTYWASDIVESICNNAIDNEWYKMYLSNEDKIRTKLYGRIREIEKKLPTTKYSELAEDKIAMLVPELHDSVNIIENVLSSILENIANIKTNDEFLSAVCESMRVELQAIGGLLAKADRLSRHRDLPLVALAHDQLADRAKTMALVSEYIIAKTSNKEKY